jgi:hypothetical protein
MAIAGMADSIVPFILILSLLNDKLSSLYLMDGGSLAWLFYPLNKG